MIETDVLIVDDEKELAEITKDYFNAMGITTEVVTNEKDFLMYFTNNNPKVILLDINLKDANGYEICRQIRSKSNIPIVFISVRTDDNDKIVALGVGGDDYIEKPYSLSLLSAKVKAILRRCYNMEKKNNDILIFDNLEIDLSKRILKVDKEIKELTVKEFDLLLYLINNQNKVVKKEKIYLDIWGQDSFGELSTLTVHIRKLREKIERDPSSPIHLKTIWGVGYYFEV